MTSMQLRYGIILAMTHGNLMYLCGVRARIYITFDSNVVPTNNLNGFVLCNSEGS